MKRISCNIIKDLLPLYLDNAASEESRELIEGHLRECEDCRKEADKMGAKLPIPSCEQAQDIKTLRRKITRRQAAAVCTAVLATLIVAFMLVFYVIFLGNSVSSNDVSLITEFQYGGTSYLGQEWVLHIDLKNDHPLNAITQSVYTEDENAKKYLTGQIIYLRELPIKIGGAIECGNYTTGFSYGENADDTPPKDYDFTITIVCSDKTIVYSMREEGLFEKQDTIHK